MKTIAFILILFNFISCADSEEKRKLIERSHQESSEILTRFYKTDSLNKSILIDSILQESQIAKNFEIEKDEFNGTEWFKPKTAPKQVNENGIYCYFLKPSIAKCNFRLRIQYVGVDVLFIKKYQFFIDGRTYELIPENIKRDSKGSGSFEWYDAIVRGNDTALINALGLASTAKIKFIGTNYQEVKEVTPTQLKSIHDTLILFRLLRGEFDSLF